MAIITKYDFRDLASQHHAFCISIYIPTHRSGPDAQKQDIINLKNQLQEVKNNLKDQDIDTAQAEKILSPVHSLVNDSEFWRHQSDGLALFITPDYFRYFEIPVSFAAANYVSNSFYLKPLIPMFTGDGMFFILALQADDTNLYQATRNSITSIKISDLIPDELEETVGYDYEQKTFQFRTQKGGSTVFHGHGAGKDDVKAELKEYFRDIDKGLMKILHDEHMPMLLAGDDHILAIYKEVNKYKHLMEETLDTNPSSMDATELQRDAWDIVEPHFTKDLEEKKQAYGQYFTDGQAVDDNAAVLQAALTGRVDTLFQKNDDDLYGVYDLAKNDLKITSADNPSAASLSNMAAVAVMQHGGEVYLLPAEEMPQPAGLMNALLRY